MKIFVVFESEKIARDVIDEEGDFDDDGFDSETRTITPAASQDHDYYNSLEHLNPENLPLKSIPAAKHRPPMRGNSESIGSLEIDASGSEHDYYNELPPAMKSVEEVSLNLGGAVRWSAVS